MTDERDRYQTLSERLRPGSEVIRWWPLEGGVSAHVTAVELALPEGGTERVVVRRHGAIDKGHNPDIAATEFRVLQVVTEAGLRAPDPLLLDETGELLGSSGLVTGFVDGATEVAPSDLPDALRQMATFLSCLHAIDLSTLDLPSLPRNDDPTDNTMRYLPGGPLGERIRAAHASHGLIMPANRRALLHGDFWPGNVMWRDGRLVAVLDWEDAAIGDPVADLAGSRNELLWKYGRDAREQFTALYLSMTSIDLANLPFWEISGAAGALALMGGWGLDPDVEADMRAKCKWAIDRALAILS